MYEQKTDGSSFIVYPASSGIGVFYKMWYVRWCGWLKVMELGTHPQKQDTPLNNPPLHQKGSPRSESARPSLIPRESLGGYGWFVRLFMMLMVTYGDTQQLLFSMSAARMSLYSMGDDKMHVMLTLRFNTCICNKPVCQLTKLYL